MSIPPIEGPQGSEKIEDKKLAESKIAYQRPSEGGFLGSKEMDWWEWFIFILSYPFQWVTAFFTNDEKVTKLATQFPEAKALLTQLTSDELFNLEKLIHEAPAVTTYIQGTPEVIKSLLVHPAKARYVFQLVDSAKSSDKDVCKWLLEEATIRWLDEFRGLLDAENEETMVQLKNSLLTRDFPTPKVKGFIEQVALEKKKTWP